MIEVQEHSHAEPAVLPPPGHHAYVLFREARRRRRRRRLFWSGLVLIGVVALFVVLDATRQHGDTLAPTVRSPNEPGAAAPFARYHLDILSAQTQISVQVSETTTGNAKVLVQSANPAAGAALAFPRRDYVLGSNGSGSVSLSDNLQKVLHVWSPAPGQYPAPASDPADVWLSQPYGTPSVAQEFDKYETAIAPAVPIPPGSIVLGQFGPVLVLQSAQPAALLELWNPSTHTIVTTLGPFDQVAVSSHSVAWTSANHLSVATADDVVRHEPSGAAGDAATALSFSPNGSDLATVWAPAAGSEFAASRRSIDRHCELSLLDVGSGYTVEIPDGQGTVGPVTWAANGTRIFFAQSSPTATSVGLSTYRVGDAHSGRVAIPGLTLPSSFGPPSGSVFGWNG